MRIITERYAQFRRNNPKFTGCILDPLKVQRWLVNGKLHRTEGPALEYADGSKYWYLNGEETTEKQVMRLKKLKAFMSQ